MNVVDSSGWLEFFAAGPNADFFAVPLQDTAALLVPTVSIYEVFKALLRQRDEAVALRAVAQMRAGRVADLDEGTALTAASLSHASGLPMAGSIILATARKHGATLWTQDADFEGLEGVRFRPRMP